MRSQLPMRHDYIIAQVTTEWWKTLLISKHHFSNRTWAKTGSKLSIRCMAWTFNLISKMLENHLYEASTHDLLKAKTCKSGRLYWGKSELQQMLKNQSSDCVSYRCVFSLANVQLWLFVSLVEMYRESLSSLPFAWIWHARTSLQDCIFWNVIDLHEIGQQRRSSYQPTPLRPCNLFNG